MPHPGNNGHNQRIPAPLQANAYAPGLARILIDTLSQILSSRSKR
jgi:hypothetical protein